jgi:hypothetical protein
MRTVPYLYRGGLGLVSSLLANHCKQMGCLVPGGGIEPPMELLPTDFEFPDIPVSLGQYRKNERNLAQWGKADECTAIAQNM